MVPWVPEAVKSWEQQSLYRSQLLVASGTQNKEMVT